MLQTSPPTSLLPDWIMAAFTIVLAVLAGAQFWAMQRQAEYMRLQAEQMRKQGEHMHEALVETRVAANAAHSASSAAKLATEVAKKATVDIESVLSAQSRAMQQQAEYMRGHTEQLRKQTEHMQGALVETRVAANAAQSASVTAKTAVEISNRANVNIESILLRDPRPVGNRRIENLAARSCIEITLRNHGTTAAKELFFEFKAAMPPYIEEPVCIAGEKAELHTQGSATSVFKPVQEMRSDFFHDADVNIFLEDLRVDGHIRYKDIFGHCYHVECSAAFKPEAWQFDVVTNVRSDA